MSAYPTSQAMWQQVVLQTLVVILSWRNGRADPARSWSKEIAMAVHNASCSRVLDTLAHRCSQHLDPTSPNAPMIREQRALFADGSPPHPSTAPIGQVAHVLFFDGGSRRNPGPGGSGACVVRVGTLSGHADIVWSAAMSHANPSTTNNQAEYCGLLAELRAARHYGWSDLEVVGDSAMITRQMRDYHSPKNPRLRRLYSEARQLGDLLDVRSWTHHVRANNRMADYFANLAMNDAASSQVSHPTTRPGHSDLRQILGNDITPWLADSPGVLLASY